LPEANSALSQTALIIGIDVTIARNPPLHRRSSPALEASGIIPIVIAGSLLHFAWEWSGHLPVLAVLGAVNDSVWEHLKLAFWPSVMWSCLLLLVHRVEWQAYVLPRAIGCMTSPLTICAIYYTYLPMAGRNILAIDIGIFVVGVTVGQFITGMLSAKLPVTRSAVWSGVVLFGLQMIAYSFFTHHPPHVGLFEEVRTGIYGIP
jgi:hypothetical protein